jgi:hypothetical protein
LPDEVRIYTIVGQQFQPDGALSPALELAMPAMSNCLMGDLSRARALAGSDTAQTS